MTNYESITFPLRCVYCGYEINPRYRVTFSKKYYLAHKFSDHLKEHQDEVPKGRLGEREIGDN